MPDFTEEFDNEVLRQLNIDLKEKRNREPLDKIGWDNLVKALGSNTKKGLDLDNEKLEERRRFFGANVLPQPPRKWPTYYWYQAMKDPIILLLFFFSILTLVVTVALQEGTGGYIEGIAIFVAVLLVTSVSSFQDFIKEGKFRELADKKGDREFVTVLRGGKQHSLNTSELVVGDIVVIKDGAGVAGDGILFKIATPVECDESAITGETRHVKKSPEKVPYMVSGTKTPKGEGSLMLVTAVGLNSEWGIISTSLDKKEEQTPLQENLEKVAALVGWIGAFAALLTFIALTINYIIDAATTDDYDPETLVEFISYFVIAITIIVVAVPEGLPLAVTIALAYSMKSMYDDKCFVRHLSACETMGSATQICSDKTGTLTENKMRVTRVWSCGHLINDNIKENLPKKIGKKGVKAFLDSVCLNCTGHLEMDTEKQTMTKVGKNCTPTEGALLILCDEISEEGNEKIRDERKKDLIQLYPFSSTVKRMSHRYKSGSDSFFYVKGASEVVLRLCSSYLTDDGNTQKIESKFISEMEGRIKDFASDGLRTLTIAFRKDAGNDLWPDDEPTKEDECVFVALVGIEDPLREGVPESIEQCKRAGIKVRMVTGDFELTAKKIASDCGIYEEGDIVLTGPEFREMPDEELDKILPRLSVLARSAPSDKLKLVDRLRRMKEVVGVTGDGTNDAPALAKADVGLAMGIAGTDIAQEAADIIILDDNFTSIVRAVKWGRNVRNNIQKFLQFQLTINLVALTIAFIGAASRNGFPLTPIQLLWVNLIQDTLAALALATDKPNDSLLDKAPPGRHERLITPILWKNMILTALWQLAILLTLMFAGDRIFGLDEDVNLGEEPSVQFTILFNTFVFFQIFNEFNARILDQGWQSWNPFDHIFRPNFNWIFFTVITVTAVLQAVFVSVGSFLGDAINTAPLTWYQWLGSVGFALTIFPIGTLIRVFVHIPDWKWLRYSRKYIKIASGEEVESESDEEKHSSEEELEPIKPSKEEPSSSSSSETKGLRSHSSFDEPQSEPDH